MNLLFIGNVVPDEYSIKIKSNSLAGNKFQSKLIKELRVNNNCDVYSFVAVPLSENNKKDIDSFNDKHNKFYYKSKNLLKDINNYKKEIKKVINNYDAVIAYNVAYPWLGLPNISKKIKSVLVLADFSDSESYNNVLLKLYSKICKLDIKKYNYVIGLSETTKRILSKKQRFICIPGGIDLKDYNFVKPITKAKKIKLMYSGNLSPVTGVDLLMDAVSKMNRNDFELIVTGRGELEEKLNKNKDKRINYYGSIPYREYLKLLNSANILVNPRNMNLPENQNNFPSKVLDYLATGKVVVSTKFIGYEKFKDNFVFCESDVDSIKEKIEKTIEEYKDNYISVFNKNTIKAKEYDWQKQVKKIIEMIEEV